MSVIKKVASEVKIGDEIKSPFFRGIWGIVNEITSTEKKINFHIAFTQHIDGKEYIGKKWCYSFFKTTKIMVKEKTVNLCTH